MPEEKRSLPPVKEFLEQMYGVKLEEPKPWTPEYRAKVVRKMEEYAREQGYGPDFSQGRFHHEIYLSDVRRCKPEKLKTVIRQPIKRAE